MIIVLLSAGPPPGSEGYQTLRDTLSAISRYILLPSLGVALVSGLFSMAVHTPFMEMRWVWIKALMGILMFKGILTVDGVSADIGAMATRRLAGDGLPDRLLSETLFHEWALLWVMLVLCVANVVLGVWRPLFRRLRHRRTSMQA
ncbi:hypothetical protein GCM10011316_19150 [Roseibium aquae]|uniref:Uncharacterized protein n=1 Tax=Roseibium aquae TaxID=1323746 RepID=A0A916TIP3_9HYPH|nr:hypothetical protein GCM10011316_19150 [Roseibium aquae]